MKPLVLFDTTLRDGAQMPGVNLSPESRGVIADALEGAGVPAIELGFPAAGSQEIDAIRAAAASTRRAVLSVLARATRADIDAACAALEAVPPARRAIGLFIGTSPAHRESKLRRSPQEILASVAEATSYARTRFRTVGFGAEDASRTEPAFLSEVFRVALESGATSVCLTDTVGIYTPEDVTTSIRALRRDVPALEKAMLAVHFHDDLGLATANTLAAVVEGASVLHCTVNGLGERAGNAALEELAVAIKFHGARHGRSTTVDTHRLTALSALVAESDLPPIRWTVGLCRDGGEL